MVAKYFSALTSGLQVQAQDPVRHLNTLAAIQALISQEWCVNPMNRRPCRQVRRRPSLFV